jgi:hypothetical protein
VSGGLSSNFGQNMSTISVPVVVRLALIGLATTSWTACSDGGETTPPAPVVLVDAPDLVRAEVVAAIASLGDGPVETRTVGSAGGESVVAVAAVDPDTGGMRLDETLNDVVRTEFVLVEGVLYARIYAVTDPPPGFTVSRPDALTQGFYDEALTGSGRVFGAVSTLGAVFDRASATVYSIGDGEGGRQGYRFVFDASDVGTLLVDEGLEASVVVPAPGIATTTFDVWLDPGLRELTTAGAVYQDGELIDDVALTIEFTPVDDAGIRAPDDTLAP